MPVKKRQPLVILYTGNGKGKTTAALGLLFRAWGRGMKVCMLSFIKEETANFGEEQAARKLDIEMIPLGAGFTWLSKDIEHDKALARHGWEVSKGKIDSGEYDVIILDEITYPITYGWLDVDEVIATLSGRPPDLHIVITGRDAHEKLIDYADLVTEMREVKHPFASGVKAQPGVDF